MEWYYETSLMNFEGILRNEAIKSIDDLMKDDILTRYDGDVKKATKEIYRIMKKNKEDYSVKVLAERANVKLTSRKSVFANPLPQIILTIEDEREANFGSETLSVPIMPLDQLKKVYAVSGAMDKARAVLDRHPKYSHVELYPMD